ncbi:hypothetical protein [Amycolatopsis sp. NPDC059021]|uniref:hypothetical protein n=1 Tax=Amycolatopsis sp. NPDC059021 TaxID=3346704 RepID=UPI00366FFB03
MITSLDDACRLLRAVPQLGFVSRPYMLLPLLRTGCISVVLSSERADAGWARRFDAELLSAEQLAPVRSGARVVDVVDAVDRLVSDLPGLVGPGTPLARLVSRRALTTAEGTALDSRGCRLVGALSTMFEVEPMAGAEWC